MAAPQNKRALPTKVAAMKARKRQRLDGSEVAKTEIHAKPAPVKNIRLEDLNWKEVDMPDRMDDFEGFFGLEEIDDVDIVKEDGKISYRATNKNATTPSEETEDAEKSDDGEMEIEGDADEWGGFEDDADIISTGSGQKLEASASEPDPSLTKKQVAKLAKDQAKADKKKADKKLRKTTKAQDDKALSFSAIGDLLDDAETGGVDISAWQPLKLSADTLSSLSSMKFAKPTPIQEAAIPEILAGHDVVGKASTGSGKTLAFGIPILERFLELQSSRKLVKKDVTDEEKARTPALALILSPTRELAHQISADLTKLCAGITGRGPAIATLTGGLSILKQQRLLQTADIVIGTPGRLWEVISGGHGILKWLRQINFLVIDEADRLLSQGHFKEVEEILGVLDQKEQIQGEEEGSDDGPLLDGQARERQTLVFSATFGKDLQQKLAGKQRFGAGLMDKKESMEYLLKKLNFREEKPKFVDVNPVKQMASGLKEGMVECGGTEKDLYLYALLLLHANARALVFCNSISAVRRLTPFLQQLRMPVLPLHSQMAQKARLRSLERFTLGDDPVETKGSGPAKKTGSILIATDVAARGLHIPNVNLVIHYHLPRAADTYVHRSGRTARAGEKGSSILICGPEEVAGTRRLIAKVHAKSAVGATDLDDAAKNGFFIRSLDIDRRVVAKLKPRATLAKQLADTTIAKEKKHSENDFLREAAEDLGIDYDSDTFEGPAPGKRGRGAGRERKEKAARAQTKDEIQSLKWQLAELLKQRINVGVSERYLTSGGVDIDELLRAKEAGVGPRGEFLGSVREIGMDD